MYIGISSVIALLYRQSGIDRPAKLKDEISLYCKGSKFRGVTLEQQVAFKILEMKRPMKFEVHKYISKWLFESLKKEHGFAHLLFVIEWNIDAFVFSVSENVST